MAAEKTHFATDRISINVIGSKLFVFFLNKSAIETFYCSTMLKLESPCKAAGQPSAEGKVRQFDVIRLTDEG